MVLTGYPDDRGADDPAGAARRDWYERELGWPVTGGPSVELRTGVRFDVLDVPLSAGLAVLRRYAGTGPAAVAAGRALLLVAAGSADEVPGVLEWLEWGGVELDLAVRGAGGRMPAPAMPGETGRARLTAAWLRPPEPGREVERTLPSVALAGCGPRTGTRAGVVGLVRVIGAVANECHRSRILSA